MTGRPAPIAIVGAGPCGLACARELLARGVDDVVVFEAREGPGGLAASHRDARGFTWDRGGHVVFSHIGEYDRLVSELLGDDGLLWHDRSSFVHVGGRFVPYPFQDHLHHLPEADARDCLAGLVAAQHARSAVPAAPPPADFDMWVTTTFGAGIAARFMRPYNEKVWARPLAVLGTSWVAERVAVVDAQAAAVALARRVDAPAWGPNSRFAYPRAGGTGAIFERLAAVVGSEHIKYRKAVTAVDLAARTLSTADGDTVGYRRLVWTGPLDTLVAMCRDADPGVLRAARALEHTSVTVVGVGYATPLADDRSWLYFPDPAVPFYRLTNLAKYSPSNVPGGRTDRFCSWMAEVARDGAAPSPDPDALAAAVDQAIRVLGLVPADAATASVHIDEIPYAYPVPTRDRDRALAVIEPWLNAFGVLARGRFGTWRYEQGNMDHAVAMGLAAGRSLAALHGA